MKRLRGYPRFKRPSVSHGIHYWTTDLQFQPSLLNMAEFNVSHLDEV